MIERTLTTVAALVVPATGLALQASRRDRLRRRIDESLQLADQWKPYDGALANEFERLARGYAQLLIDREGRSLQRKVDPYAIAAILFLTIPAVIALVWTLGWHSHWRWAVITALAIWTLLWAGVGITQLWQERAEYPDLGRDSSDENVAA